MKETQESEISVDNSLVEPESDKEIRPYPFSYQKQSCETTIGREKYICEILKMKFTCSCN